MNTASPPLVSILTPVYNGAEHLAECIESVLRQTYRNWAYTIVDNCSRDGSLAIAQKYAALDERVHVISNEQFLPIIENHNRTIRQLSPESKYCKLVFADDWLYPHCIEEMVRLAENNPSVGLVAGFTTNGQSVVNTIPLLRGAVRQSSEHPAYVIPGAEVCRNELLRKGDYVFATMTSLLLRCDLIRKRPVFFNEPHLHADHESCLEVLSESDFGFCQQVLSCTRPRAQSTSSFAVDFDLFILGKMTHFLKYADKYLLAAERRRVWASLSREYYRTLAHNVLRLRSQGYWKYHQDTLASYGYKLNPFLFVTALLSDVANQLLHPVNAIARTCHWWSQAVKRFLAGLRVQRQPAP